MNFKLVLLSCISLILNINGEVDQKTAPIYYSQVGQDKYLNEEIFHGKKNGVFIDIGAHNGISISNTYFFEKNLGWTGICIEPNPDVYKELEKNRTAICLQACISNYNGKVEFLKVTGYAQMLSGIKDTYDQRHLARVDREIALYGGSKEIIDIDVYTLDSVIKKYGISKIDFLSLDTEGSELLVLQSIDFDTTQIDYIVIENNFNDNKIKKYLISKGYSLIKKLSHDDIYKKN